jgi:hypothetical protein
VALASALIAPALGLLVLAALAALALTRPHQPVAWRLGAFEICGLVAVISAAVAAGLAGATGAAFVWFVADAARACLRDARGIGAGAHGFRGERVAVFLAAGFAILMVAASAPHVVMGLPLDLPHPPANLIVLVGVAYSLAVADWLLRVLARWRLGEGALAPAMDAACFHMLLLIGFVASSDASAGLAALMAYRMTRSLRPIASADQAGS